MGFTDQIKAQTTNIKAKIAAKESEVGANAQAALSALLGPDLSQIESIALDGDIGKFYDVVAPASVVEKLRLANLLKL